MASLAADPGAIAPTLPPLSRSDAASLAGPSSAFADLLDAAAPATGSQSQGSSNSRTDEGSSAAQSGATIISGNGSSDPAASGAVPARTSNGKNGAGTDTNDPTTVLDTGSATLDVTLVAGLLLPSVPLAATPDANQTQAAAQDPLDASADATPAIGGNAGGKQDDRKDASASSDPVAAAVVAAVPNVIPIPVPAGAAVSVSDLTTGIAWSPVRALASDAMLSAPTTGTPAAGADAASSGASALQTDQTAHPPPKLPDIVQDALSDVPSVASALAATDDLHMAAAPPGAAGAGASDQNGRPASAATPAVAPARPPSPFTPITALAPLNPALAEPVSAEVHVAAQPADKVGASLEAEGAPMPLPAQVAVRGAASVHADDDNTPDHGTDVLSGYAGRDLVSPTAISNSGPGGTAVPANFNSGLAMVQAVSAPTMTPSHAAVMPDAVPLAGIPIAIVARAEAGEKKFEIRLDPPDLGRIEVQLNVDSSGRATSHLIVDRADTLDLLRRDAPALERALQSAGLTTGNGALQFSLRDQSFAGRDQGAPTPVAPPIPAAPADSDLAPVDTALRRYGAPMGLGGGIDIRV